LGQGVGKSGFLKSKPEPESESEFWTLVLVRVQRNGRVQKALPQQWQLLHVEKDDQVIRHNNNKTWETKEKNIRKAFLFKALVNKTENPSSPYPRALY
jgi:hypothetical protein